MTLQFIPFTDEHIEYVFKGLSHPEVVPYYGVSYESLEATESQMEWSAQQSQDWFGIWKDEGETFVGGVGLSGIEEGKEIAEIGMWLLPEFWGKGIFAEDLDFIVDHAKNK